MDGCKNRPSHNITVVSFKKKNSVNSFRFELNLSKKCFFFRNFSVNNSFIEPGHVIHNIQKIKWYRKPHFDSQKNEQ